MNQSSTDSFRSIWEGCDIHLLDLLLKGKLDGAERVLDLGAGRGRNGLPFHAQGCALTSVDRDVTAFEDYPVSDRIVTLHGAFEEMEWSAEHDLVVVCAVLHFARDIQHWRAMAEAAWSAVAPGGVLFVRTASTIGLSSIAPRLPEGGFTVGQGEQPFLVDAEEFLVQTHLWNAQWLEPLRTSVVEGGRCMTTWVLQKPNAPTD